VRPRQNIAKRPKILDPHRCKVSLSLLLRPSKSQGNETQIIEYPDFLAGTLLAEEMSSRIPRDTTTTTNHPESLTSPVKTLELLNSKKH